MVVTRARVVRRHTSYDSYGSEVGLKDIFSNYCSDNATSSPYSSWRSFDSISLSGSWNEERKPAVRAQYADCHTRMDILNRMWDAEGLKARPYLQPVTQWPPQDYDCTFRPPKLDHLSAPFSVSSCPDFLNEAYDQMVTSSKEYLERSLDPEQLVDWIELEADRLEDVVGSTLGWLDLDDIPVQHDRYMYKPLSFFSDVLPLPAELENIRNTPLSIEVDRRDWVLLAERPKKTPSCLIRLLHMTYLDVCDEIQDIASQSLQTKLKDNKPEWPPLKHWTPPHGKAQSILAWVSTLLDRSVRLINEVFHASRPDKTVLQGHCNYVKLSDGRRTIWFFVENGHIKVGPTMTPTLSNTLAPTQDAPFGLVHAFLGCAAEAGKKLAKERLKLKAKAKKGVADGAKGVSRPTAKITSELSCYQRITLTLNRFERIRRCGSPIG
jgi:hypothetical protein